MPSTKSEPKKVIILGGGIAGLSAAQELGERGFEVEVYERNSIPGGKARSMYIPNSGKDGRRNLPAEHGFRFFPGFYTHIFDTMGRIPYEDKPRGVLDNLVKLDKYITSTSDTKLMDLTLDPFKFFWESVSLLTTKSSNSIGIPDHEGEVYLSKVWQYWTSSRLRRFKEYESISWWDYIEAEGKSKEYQNYLAKGQTTQLVATKAQKASTRTVGEAGFRLAVDIVSPFSNPDQILNGPTNEVFIQPWVDYLRSLGVSYKLSHSLESIELTRGKISGVRVKDLKKNNSKLLQADYYLFALPVEVMVRFLTQEILDADPHLNSMFDLSKRTEWMNGIMFYLKQPLKIDLAHIAVLDSPWALTGLSQTKGWTEFDVTKSGDGQVQEILSIAVSDWQTPGIIYGKPAKDCTPEEIQKEVWEQLKAGLNNPVPVLEDPNLHDWFLDPDIIDVDTNPSKKVNLEPLLVNEVDTWQLRPTTNTNIPNMLLAGDYVKTHTDLATMESANESARRAVNHILNLENYQGHLAKLWEFDRPFFLKPLLLYDAWRFKRGLPWKSAPWVVLMYYRMLVVMHNVLNFTNRSRSER